MGWFDRPAVEAEPQNVVQPEEPESGYRVIWGESCFAEYDPDRDPDEAWCVQKYDSVWNFCLYNEPDAVALMARLDARAKIVPPILVYGTGTVGTC